MSSHIHSDGSEKMMNSAPPKWLVILSFAVIAFIVDHFYSGWGRSTLITLTVFGCTIAFCPADWGRRFWVAFAVFFGLHIFAVLHWRWFINQMSMPALFVCAVAEVLVIAALITFLVPDRS